MRKKQPNRFFFLIYLLPIVILVLLVTVPKFDFGERAPEPSPVRDETVDIDLEKPVIAKFFDELKDDPSEVPDEEERLFESRIPIYPEAEKAALSKTVPLREAVFYTTDDPIEDVFEWYKNRLNIYENQLMLVDFTREGVRTITITMPDEPKELIEIKRPFFGLDQTGITLTTMKFYISSQPRWMGVDDDMIEDETTDDDESEQSNN